MAKVKRRKITKKKAVGTPSKKASKVLSLITPVANVEEYSRFTVYGRSGTGKTTLFGDFPKPSLLIMLEKGTKSIKNISGIDAVKINNSDQLTYLLDNFPTKYKTVGLDTVTKLRQLHLREVLGLEELPTQQGWGLASRKQYGQASLRTTEHLNMLFKLQRNIVVLGHEKAYTPDEDAAELLQLTPFVSIDAGGAAAQWLETESDFILQTFIRDQVTKKEVKVSKSSKKSKMVERRTGKVEYCLRTGPNSVYIIKFRTVKGQTAPEVIVDPTYKKLVKAIEGAK